MSNDEYILRIGFAPLSVEGLAFASTTEANATRFPRIGDAMKAAAEIGEITGIRGIANAIRLYNN